MFIRTGVFLFLTLFFTILLGGTQEATGILIGQVILPQLAPGLAALAMLLMFRKDGLALNFSVEPLTSLPTLLAVFIPVGAAVITFIIVTQSTQVMDIAEVSIRNSPVSLIGMVIGAVGEELGWRGYWHKMLNQRWAGVVSSLVVGVPWALWHVGMYQNGLIFMLLLAILITSYSFVLYFLVERIGFNIWVAAVFHLVINLTNIAFVTVLEQTTFMLVNALVWAVIAGGIVVMNRGLYFTQPDLFSESTRRTSSVLKAP